MLSSHVDVAVSTNWGMRSLGYPCSPPSFPTISFCCSPLSPLPLPHLFFLPSLLLLPYRGLLFSGAPWLIDPRDLPGPTSLSTEQQEYGGELSQAWACIKKYKALAEVRFMRLTSRDSCCVFLRLIVPEEPQLM